MEKINLREGSRIPFVMNGIFNDDMIQKITKFYIEKEFQNFVQKFFEKKEEIGYVDIYINSSGGNLNDAILARELIENHIKSQSSNIKIVVHLIGMCHSASILFIGVGDIRVLYQSTTMVFHGVTSDENGRKTLGYNQRIVEKSNFLNSVMEKYYMQSGFKKDFVDDLFKDLNNDRFITHEEMIYGGIVTHVSPSYVIK